MGPLAVVPQSAETTVQQPEAVGHSAGKPVQQGAVESLSNSIVEEGQTEMHDLGPPSCQTAHDNCVIAGHEVYSQIAFGSGIYCCIVTRVVRNFGRG
ncbi:hypothetical protein VNO78_08502 [Psophocarpus tetragonolobus]|uniref:Uncharacterized protein n=1 Tax=Psophocarpus tetragonolobus TaxID=3891 RepID=A0AAN9XT17_PSOTE